MSTKTSLATVQATTPTLQVIAPQFGAVVLPGRLHVVGIATGKLSPEPFLIGAVTVAVDSGAPVHAVLTQLPPHPTRPRPGAFQPMFPSPVDPITST